MSEKRNQELCCAIQKAMQMIVNFAHENGLGVNGTIAFFHPDNSVSVEVLNYDERAGKEIKYDLNDLK